VLEGVMTEAPTSIANKLATFIRLLSNGQDSEILAAARAIGARCGLRARIFTLWPSDRPSGR
jgi:hypothetical protein